MNYFVSPPAPTDWRLDPDEFAEALVRQWPGAHVEEVTDPRSKVALDFDLHLDGQRVDGTLSRNGQAVALDADLQPSARIARWLRSIVPESQPLLFYDEGYLANVQLTAGTTEEDLTRPFLGH